MIAFTMHDANQAIVVLNQLVLLLILWRSLDILYLVTKVLEGIRSKQIRQEVAAKYASKESEE